MSALARLALKLIGAQSELSESKDPKVLYAGAVVTALINAIKTDTLRELAYKCVEYEDDQEKRNGKWN